VGSKARVEAFGVTFCVSLGAAARAGAGHWYFDKKYLPFVIGSAALQLGLLGAFSCFRAPPLAAGEVSEQQVYTMQIALASADEKELGREEAAATSAQAADKEGGTGARAKGEEGSMGAPGTAQTGVRYGIMGAEDRSDTHLARSASQRDAAEFGMIGLLNSGAGSHSQPPERDDASAGLGLAGIGTLGHGAGQGVGEGGGRLGGLASVAPSSSPPPVLAPTRGLAAPDVPIDPNGRFATTYRPGGGHLAAFESAVARGIVPEAAREVVSDVGARYAPPVDVPAGKALGLRADVERGLLAPGGGAFHLRLSLRSSGEAPAARPHLSVHLVLDVSGSMGGESIHRAREAAEALVDKLAPTDDFSLTTFSSDAAVRVPDGAVGPRRGQIKAIIEGIDVGGGTNIGEGLRRGYQQASLPGIPEDAVRVVLLLSDGQANEGVTGRESLSGMALGAFQHGIQTSSFGLGPDYDGALMSAIAADGAGGYYYLRDASQIAPALATELEKRADPVATAVEIRVRLKKGVELLRVYGSRRLSDAEAARARALEVAADEHAAAHDHIAANRQEDVEGGMRFLIPGFARDDAHALLFKLQVPPGAGTRPLALVELKYKDRLVRKNVVEEVPLTLRYADSDGASGASIDASVARTAQGFAAGEALTSAAARIAAGDRAGAVAMLTEREAILRQAAATLGEPLFLRDADRLERLRGAAGSSDGLGEPLVLAMLLETAGRAHLR
jgi:Mg-chelatase subunit ChlD